MGSTIAFWPAICCLFEPLCVEMKSEWEWSLKENVFFLKLGTKLWEVCLKNDVKKNF